MCPQSHRHRPCHRIGSRRQCHRRRRRRRRRFRWRRRGRLPCSMVPRRRHRRALALSRSKLQTSALRRLQFQALVLHHQAMAPTAQQRRRRPSAFPLPPPSTWCRQCLSRRCLASVLGRCPSPCLWVRRHRSRSRRSRSRRRHSQAVWPLAVRPHNTILQLLMLPPVAFHLLDPPCHMVPHIRVPASSGSHLRACSSSNYLRACSSSRVAWHLGKTHRNLWGTRRYSQTSLT